MRSSAGFEEEKVEKARLDRTLLRRLVAYLRPYRSNFVTAIVLLLAASVGDLVFPLLVKRAIDVHIAPRDFHGLVGLSLVYLALLVVVFGLRYFHLWLTQLLGQRIMHDLRNQIFSHLQRLHVAYFDRNPVGRTMTRLTSDVEVLNEMFTSGMVSIFGDVITLFGIMGVLLYLNWKLALVTWIVIPLLFVASMIFRAKVRASYALVRIKIAAINAYLQENIAGISLVQLFNRQEIHRRQFDRRNAEHRDAFLRSVFYFSVFFPVVELLESLAVALILWYGGGQVLRSALTLGALVAFIQYSERFFRPIRDLSERYNILQGAMAASERIFDLLDTRPEIADPPAPAAAPGPAGRIEFRDVRFGYVPGKEVLSGVSFTVEPGEAVALVGHTGAGKTTITSLLSRFYDVTAGSVRVDGLDVRGWGLAELRSKIGIVQQEGFLWSGSVALNVGLRGGIPQERIAQALRVVGASHLLERSADGAALEVGERGSQLSVGERQLISFARALAFDPPILILDEATSSVDTETEQKIRRALTFLLQGRTSLVIAHRLSTIRHVDRILVLHKGRLVEEGTHDELLRRGGLYSRYYELEYRPQEAEAMADPAGGAATPDGARSQAPSTTKR
jgi:ATP-binding cassette subfamily B multidrug efflux pump